MINWRVFVEIEEKELITTKSYVDSNEDRYLLPHSVCFRFSVDCDYNQNKSNLSEETSMRIVLLKLQEKNISEISRHLNI